MAGVRCRATRPGDAGPGCRSGSSLRPSPASPISIGSSLNGLATSAEVLPELLHVYLPVGRTETLDAALRLAADLTTVWPIDASDVRAVRDLAVSQPGPGARDPLHLAICRRYDVGDSSRSTARW